MGKQWGSKGGGMSGRSAARMAQEARSGWGTVSGGSVNGRHRGQPGGDKEPKRGSHRRAGVRYSWWDGKPVDSAPKKTVWGGRADKPAIRTGWLGLPVAGSSKGGKGGKGGKK